MATGHPAGGAVYVVDQTAPGAADSNLGGEQQPFQSIQRAADVAQPGDTLYVMAGRYDERVRIATSGREHQPVTLRAMPRRSAAVLGFDLQASYIRVEGFEIAAGNPAVAVHLGGSFCEVVDNDIHDMRVAVSGTNGKLAPDGNTRDYSEVAHNRIAYNHVQRVQYGFMLGGDDWLVEDNEVNRLFMFSPGARFEDCDYSRFFGKGCVERRNYFHGSTAGEIRVAHVDGLQTFTVNGEIAQDVLFESNTCFDFHQLCMVESAPHIGSVRNWTLRGNIVSANAPTMSGGWGPDIIQTPEVTIANNTICTVRWATIGLRGKESTGGHILNNILCNAERAVVHGDGDFSAANPIIEYNLTFTDWPVSGEHNLHGKDPLFVDAAARNFRLREGSPAIGAGKGGGTVGALEYPNVYYVDPRHPAATDEPAWGYPAVPLATATKACALARTGETIILQGGVYRETLRPGSDGVTIRGAKGESVTISGADLVEGWKRQADGSWAAPLTRKPARLLRDGLPWERFEFDPARDRIVVHTGSDPRLHVFETVVREKGIDLDNRRDVTIGNIVVVNTL